MAIDTNTTVGKLAEKYVNLFSNSWNHDCDICWWLFGAAVHGVLGFSAGYIAKALIQ